MGNGLRVYCFLSLLSNQIQSHTLHGLHVVKSTLLNKFQDVVVNLTDFPTQAVHIVKKFHSFVIDSGYSPVLTDLIQFSERKGFANEYQQSVTHH